MPGRGGMWFQVLSQAAVRDGVELDSTARGEWPLSAAGSSIGFFSSASLEQPLHQLYTCSVFQLELIVYAVSFRGSLAIDSALPLADMSR